MSFLFWRKFIHIFLLFTGGSRRTSAEYPSKGNLLYDWVVISLWSISTFPCSLARNITSRSMENLAFHILLGYKSVILPIPATPRITQMKDDYTTKSHHLAYTSIFKRFKRLRISPAEPPVDVFFRAKRWSTLLTAVALAFEEMQTPYASRRESCVRKFRNAYERKEIETRMTPSNDSPKSWNAVRKRCALSFHNTRVASVIVCLMSSLRRVETEARFFFAYTSLPWFCMRLDLYAYYTQKFALTRPLLVNVASVKRDAQRTDGIAAFWVLIHRQTLQSTEKISRSILYSTVARYVNNKRPPLRIYELYIYFSVFVWWSQQVPQSNQIVAALKFGRVFWLAMALKPWGIKPARSLPKILVNEDGNLNERSRAALARRSPQLASKHGRPIEKHRSCIWL